MCSTITIGLTVFSIVCGIWIASLVCYHPPSNQGLNPLAPINVAVAWQS